MGKLWTSRNKGKKKSSPTLKGKKITEESREKIERGYLGIPKGLGSLGCVARPSWDWDSSRGHAQKHKEWGQICPISHPIMQKKIRRLRNQQPINNGLVPRGIQEVNHEGRWLGIFQPDRKESAHWGKMTKRKAAKRWNLEVLEKERSKVNLLGPPRMGKSVRGF